MKTANLLRLALAVTLLTTLVSIPAQAEDWIELTREIVENERLEIQLANLELTEEESETFLPLYERYRGELGLLATERAEMVERWLTTEKIPYAAIMVMLERWLELDKLESKTRLNYLPKFRKAIAPRKAVLFYQIENKLDTVIRYEIADAIPLIDWREED